VGVGESVALVGKGLTSKGEVTLVGVGFVSWARK